VTVRRAYLDVDGIQLHYRSAGDPQCPPLLLLHQSPSSSAMYETLMTQLAGKYYLLAPDTPGFGNSDPLPGEVQALEIADYARVIHDFCCAMDILPCHVFGHHTGAAIAVQLEHDFPGSAVDMALSGPTLLNEEQKLGLPQLASPFPVEESGSHLQAMWQRLRDKDPEAPLAITQRELLSAFDSGDNYQASYRAVTRQDFEGQLPGISCPVLVFAGSEDPLYGAVEPALALLARGEGLELPGGERTYVCERQAELVAAALADFFDTNGN
jgi:pimeloyl-ACP methyl ester carboxylesterase